MGSGAEGGPGEILYPPRDDAVPWTLHQHAKPVPSADSRGPRPRNPAILLSLTLPSHSDTYILHTHTHTHTHTHITHTQISLSSSFLQKAETIKISGGVIISFIPQMYPRLNSCLVRIWNHKGRREPFALENQGGLHRGSGI